MMACVEFDSYHAFYTEFNKFRILVLTLQTLTKNYRQNAIYIRGLQCGLRFYIKLWKHFQFFSI